MSEDARDVGFPEWWSVGSLEMWENTAICSVLMPSSIDIYVAAARTYVLHVRVKTKMFQYISGKIFYGNMSKLHGFAWIWAMPWLVDVEKRLICCACERKCVYCGFTGPDNLIVSHFSSTTWFKLATEAFWKHLCETPSLTFISLCGSATHPWCVPSQELCSNSAISRNVNITPRPQKHDCIASRM